MRIIRNLCDVAHRVINIGNILQILIVTGPASFELCKPEGLSFVGIYGFGIVAADDLFPLAFGVVCNAFDKFFISCFGFKLYIDLIYFA
jgi:hypothetical protein